MAKVRTRKASCFSLVAGLLGSIPAVGNVRDVAKEVKQANKKTVKKKKNKAILAGEKVAEKVKLVVKNASKTAIKKETMKNVAIRRQNPVFMGRGSGILIGTEITAGAFRVLESQKMRTVERGVNGNYNVLKFHVYENTLITKKVLPRDQQANSIRSGEKGRRI